MNAMVIYCTKCGAEIEIDPRETVILGMKLGFACDECQKILEREKRVAEFLRRKKWLLDNGFIYERTLYECIQKSNSSVELKPTHVSAYKKFREWNKRDNVYIYGPVGTGKTFLARCYLNQYFQAGKTIADRRGEDFCLCVNQGFESIGIEWLFNIPCILLDDIDKGFWTLNTLTHLLRLVNHRWENKLPILITSNMPPKGLQTFFESKCEGNLGVVASIFDRLRSRSGDSIAIELTGDSLRKAGR